MNTKFVVIGIVAVAVVVGAALLIPHFMDDSGEEEAVAGEGGRLAIYGNANFDDFLDERDVTYLQSIIDGVNEKTKYADANQDGRIDSKDIDFVKRMVARESMKIYYHDDMTNAPKAIDYPVKHVVAVESDTVLAFKILGLPESLTGYSSPLDTTLYSDVPKGYEKLGQTGPIPLESLSTIEVDAVVSTPMEAYVTNADEIEASGIPVVKLDLTSTEPASSYLTLGYLMQAEEKAAKFVEMSQAVLDYIEEKVDANMMREDKIKAIVLAPFMLFGNESEYGNVIELAGGVNACNWYNHTRVSMGFEWLYNIDFDYVIGLVSPAGYEGADKEMSEEIKKIWDPYYTVYGETKAMQQDHMFIADRDLPVYLRAAYMAAEFYPELFTFEWADQMHQEYVDTFLDNLSKRNFDITKDGYYYYNPDNIDQIIAKEKRDG